MKLKYTKELPSKEGFYFWTNFGEHTPTILEVTKDYSNGGLYASNEEFGFPIKKKKQIELDLDDQNDLKVDGYEYGEEMWCYIPCPFLPNGKHPKPNCY